jgi:hypothetical protein
VKKTVYTILLISSLLFIISILSYGTLHIGLSVNLFSSSIIIEIRDKLFYALYLLFFLTVISGLAYYKLYLK